MLEKKIDLVVFGASGVTGKFLIEELALHAQHVTWAIAGRNREKLENVIKDVEMITGVNLKDVELIIADVGCDSLKTMCCKAKLILNCVGPYRFYGEDVVKACLSAGTHYVDVCGEPQFLETMQLKYFKEACEKKVYIIGACGFDSLPCDMGVEFLRQNFVGAEHSGHVSSVESYLEFYLSEESKVNFGTWQSAVYSLAHSHELKAIRKGLREKLFNKGLPDFCFKLKARPVLFKSDVTDRWCLPFMGSDKSVVMRSQLYIYNFLDQNPIQIQTYFCLSSLLYALLFILLGAVFMFLSNWKFGRYLLEKYPEVFSCGLFTKKPLTRKQLTGGTFTMTLSGCGWSKRNAESECPDKKMKLVITGPDAGYVTTSICAVAACVTLLDEKEKMPASGGVFTPAAAFTKTNLIEKLRERDIIMNVVDMNMEDEKKSN